MFRRKTGSGKGVFLTGRRVLGNGYAVLLLVGRDLFPIFCPPVPRQGEESLGGGRGDNHANKGMGHSGTALNQTEGPTPRRPEQKLYQAISRGCRQGVKGVCDSLRVMSV